MAGKAEAEAPMVETHGSRALKNYHKGLHALRKSLGADMEPLDDGPVKAHLGEHHAGMEKALGACSKFHGKTFKGVEPLPDDYGDEENPDDPLLRKDIEDMDDQTEFDEQPVDDDPLEDGKAVGGAMSHLDESDGGALPAVEGLRPEDELAGMGEDTEEDALEDDEEMDDEAAAMLKKSLPAMERALGLRR